MIDHFVRKVIDPVNNSIGRQLARMVPGADYVTVFGFLTGLAASVAAAFGYFLPAMGLMLASRWLDGLDGSVARSLGVTDRGGYLDIVLDFIFYSSFVFGFALADPQNTLAASFLIFSFIGTSSSFLTFSIFAEKHNIRTDIRGKKSIYYLGGLTEGFETIVVFCLFCIFPDYFSLTAYIFGIACWVTTIHRVITSSTILSEIDKKRD